MNPERRATRLSPVRQSRLESLPLTYGDVVGASTGPDPLPVGYGHLRRSAVIGRGADDFRLATAAVMAWQVHLLSGLRVAASAPVAVDGTVVETRLGPGPAAVRIPCRVVSVVDEPSRRGFAYGTLPGHPETGEEAFLVHLGHDGLVTLEVVAFSCPAWWLARAGAAVTRRVQHRTVSAYLRSLAPLDQFR